MTDGTSKLMGLMNGRYDGHAHVFLKSLPQDPLRRYSPKNDAPLEDYSALLRENFIKGALLVQPSFLGTDNSYLLSNLEHANTIDDLAFRGVVVVSPDVPLSKLEDMKNMGVIGIRLNLVGQSAPDFTSHDWLALFERVNALGWHVELHLEGLRLPEILPILCQYCNSVVLDHFGLPDSSRPMECAGIKAILDAADNERFFVKTSAPYRIFPNLASSEAAARTAPIFAHLLNTLGPDRLVWGSDWPWTRYESQHNFRQTLDWLQMWSLTKSSVA